ncbi:hypothetical protein [Haloechinothrix halophila]|uniref:hypothetical protein n=1 Tax=Haloechinothrix halophila TaxID=1069073 RepID=UPI00041BE8F8|nr:hypothetical protein [Haloechinothrix halophila]
MKRLGKRGKQAPEEQEQDPRSSFAAAPLPRHAGPPASSTPLADQLARGGPGVTAEYVVLPRSIAEDMPLPWQRQIASVLEQFHHMHRDLSWPKYRVLPSREEKLTDLDEEQLAEAGYTVEMDDDGELVYRERSGRRVDEPEETTVLVTCLDPVVSERSVRRQQQAPAEPAPAPQEQPQQPAPQRAAPMNIGPQPVWQPVPGAEQPGGHAVPAQQRPQSPPPASLAEPETPARGTPMPDPVEDAAMDWPSPATGTAPASGAEPVGGDFGPTGDPIERPYRYGG